jgi:hypothetical protein
VDGSARAAVRLRFAHHCAATQSYAHDTQYYNDGGWGYGLDVTPAASDNLIEDTIAVRFDKVVNMRARGGGNVVAYNYMDDGAISWNTGWVETGLQASHHPTPHYELFEGNYVTSSVHWHGLGGAGSTPVQIPASLYRTSKPTLFGSNPGPWVNPLGTTKAHTLPAKARFYAGVSNE